MHSPGGTFSLILFKGLYFVTLSQNSKRVIVHKLCILQTVSVRLCMFLSVSNTEFLCLQCVTYRWADSLIFFAQRFR